MGWSSNVTWKWKFFKKRKRFKQFTVYTLSSTVVLFFIRVENWFHAVWQLIRLCTTLKYTRCTLIEWVTSSLNAEATAQKTCAHTLCACIWMSFWASTCAFFKEKKKGVGLMKFAHVQCTSRWSANYYIFWHCNPQKCVLINFSFLLVQAASGLMTHTWFTRSFFFKKNLFEPSLSHNEQRARCLWLKNWHCDSVTMSQLLQCHHMWCQTVLVVQYTVCWDMTMSAWRTDLFAALNSQPLGQHPQPPHIITESECTYLYRTPTQAAAAYHSWCRQSPSISVS